MRITMRDWKAKASEYIRRMKGGEVFLVNGVHIGKVDHGKTEEVDHTNNRDNYLDRHLTKD